MGESVTRLTCGENHHPVLTLDKMIQPVEHGVGRGAVRGYEHDGKLGACPNVLVGRFGDGDVESSPDSILQRLDDPPLVFEGSTLRKREIPGAP